MFERAYWFGAVAKMLPAHSDASKASETVMDNHRAFMMLSRRSPAPALIIRL